MTLSSNIQQVNIHEAKTHLSALLETKTQQGEVFIIAKAGRPVAVVEPYSQFSNQTMPLRTGFLKDELKDFELPDDFDTLMQDEIIALFEGSEQ